MIILGICFMTPEVNAETRCNLKFFEEDMVNWRNLSAGWLLGLYEDPTYNSTNCTDCWSLGEQVGLLNYGVVYVESKRD